MTALSIVRNPADLAARVAQWRSAGRRISLVPTMGALHAGHLSLLALARSHSECVVASLFVNPTQFAPSEDFDAYPRDEAGDAEHLRQAGCDLLYAPEPAAIYPPGFSTTITVAGVSAPLEGALRPTHFSGVATVVAKLLLQTRPDVAVFGEKDFQQLQVIRRLVADLELPVTVLGAPIIRDHNGLALSSRNAYLSPEHRRIAPALQQALAVAVTRLRAGERVDVVEAEGQAQVLAAGFDDLDYFTVRAPETLEALGPGPLTEPARVLTVGRLGSTRLLDNLAV